MKLENILSRDEITQFQIVDWAYTEKLEPTSYDRYSKWVTAGHAGSLNYLTDERKQKRQSLKSVYPEAMSALVFLFSYTHSKKFQGEVKPIAKVASYTTGFDDMDYHHWVKEKLELIGERLKLKNNELEFGVSLDVHPVLERDLAHRSGLGWFGKNSMLINREFGSYTVIGSLILNTKLDTIPDRNVELDHCGTCTRCIDACPTNAIMAKERSVDTEKCISTFTIEKFKDDTPPDGYPDKSVNVFGCDICQEVCPWNNKPLMRSDSKSSKWVEFFNRDLSVIMSELESMSNKGFKTFFKSTSFERLGKKGLIKNLTKFL